MLVETSVTIQFRDRTLTICPCSGFEFAVTTDIGVLIQGFWEWFCRPLLPSSFLWSRYVSESIIEGLPTKESVSAYGVTD